MPAYSPSQEEQNVAWERYAELKRTADKTLCLDDGRAAVEAWVVFINLFLPDQEKMPFKRTLNGNVSLFPVHKTRSPGGISA
ncbi:hypothetical protein GFB56_12285 [Ensifer sp. T173]|uniref:Uncharacterized protein n=1 Tax=Ensifer canadensis TaxID=555315 RepID=A0AAW4FK24_9HYPH|nr:hypothetical protein [Ensifer canadensis]MBM3091594.1 hypothetical protein [Ensifer canadensis]UBI74421.1 hypothetical protein J3R84_13070 [Ensifer canadensis]